MQEIVHSTPVQAEAASCQVCKGDWRHEEWRTEKTFTATFQDIKEAALLASRGSTNVCDCAEIAFAFHNLPPSKSRPPASEEELRWQIREKSSDRRTYTAFPKREEPGYHAQMRNNLMPHDEWPGELHTIEICNSVSESSPRPVCSKNWVDSTLDARVNVANDDSDLDLGFNSIRRVLPYSGSNDSFKLAKQWLSHCRQFHGNCNHIESLNAKTHPKRLLDVSQSSGRVYLIEVSNLSYEYATLSYCWGRGQIGLCTDSQNVGRLTSEGVDIDILPKTIRHAIQVTRALNINYLWIDRFCIVQGSEDDWLEESKKMGDIYTNSILTISADASTGLMDGMFQEHIYANGDYKEVPVDSQIGFLRPPRVWLRAELRHTGIGNHSSNTLAPIERRAWTLQESFVSTRVLHFAQEEMKWECRKGERCECQRELSRTRTESLPRLQECPSVDLVIQEWKRKVKEYTSRALTVNSDKLPALSGVAAKFEEVTTCLIGTSMPYLAGLWSADFTSQLAWCRPRPKKLLQWLWENDPSAPPRDYQQKGIEEHLAFWSSVSTRPESYVAPSWSWASCKGPVVYFEAFKGKGLSPLPFQRKIEYLYDETFVLEEDGHGPYGAIRGGQVSLEGHAVTGVSLQYACARYRPDGDGTVFDWSDMFWMVDSQDHSRTMSFYPDHPSDILCGRTPRNELVCLLLGFVDIEQPELHGGVAIVNWTSHHSLATDPAFSTEIPKRGSATDRNMEDEDVERPISAEGEGEVLEDPAEPSPEDADAIDEDSYFRLEEDRRTHPPSNPLSRDLERSIIRQAHFLLLAPVEEKQSTYPTYKRVACIQPNLTAPKESFVMRSFFNRSERMKVTII